MKRRDPAFLVLVTALAVGGLATPAEAVPATFTKPGPSPLVQVLHPGETFQFIAYTDGTAPITVTALEKPAGMTVTSTAYGGQVLWTPTASQLGVHTVHLRAQNAEGGADMVFRLAVEPVFFQIQELLVPGFPESQALGINDQGHVTGLHTGPGMGVAGFLFDGSTYTTFKKPLSTWTIGYGVNDLDQVVGTYTDSQGWHGFRWQNGQFTDYPYPGYEYHPYDIDNQGHYVGWSIYSPNSPSKAFASFAVLNLPGSTSQTYSRAFGLNDQLQVVGDYWQYGQGGFPRQGWLYDHPSGTYTVFQADGAIGTSPYGINDAGVVVGTFAAHWETGFVGSGMAFYTAPGGPVPGHFRRFGLPQATGRVHLLDVNDLGAMVGRYEFAPDDFKGFVATPILPWPQADEGDASPAGPALAAEGEPLYTGNQTTLSLTGAPPGAALVLFVGLDRADLPLADGATLVPQPLLVVPGAADAAGAFSIPDVPGGQGPLSVFVQAAVADASAPLGFRFSNALRMDFLP